MRKICLFLSLFLCMGCSLLVKDKAEVKKIVDDSLDEVLVNSPSGTVDEKAK